MTFGSQDETQDQGESQAEAHFADDGLAWRDDGEPTANYSEDRLENDLVQGLIDLAEETTQVFRDRRPSNLLRGSEDPTPVSAAREWVEGFTARGLDELEQHYLQTTHNFRNSLEYTVCEQTRKLQDVIDRYDQSTDDNAVHDDFVATEVLQHHVETLVKQLITTVTSLRMTLGQEATDEARHRNGRLSDDALVSRQLRRGMSEQKSGSRLEGAGIGMTPGSVGEVADEWGHVLEDSQADDDGEMRQQIAQKIRSMPRWLALKVIERAVADGMISEETARYLIREYVRAR